MTNFPFGTNGKLIILGVPILKHVTVLLRCCIGLGGKFLRLALFCDNAQTGETPHSVEFLFIYLDSFNNM